MVTPKGKIKVPYKLGTTSSDEFLAGADEAHQRLSGWPERQSLQLCAMVMPANPIVFLDFDGVLHPDFDWFIRPFWHASILATALEPFQADIVISSEWRLTKDLAALRTLLPVSLASRVIGKTGWHPYGRHRRYREILKWLSANKREDSLWVAIDDSPSEFPEGFGGLINCHSYYCFDTDEATQLDVWLRNPVRFSPKLDPEWERDDLDRMTIAELQKLSRRLGVTGDDDRHNLAKYIETLERLSRK